MLDSLDVSVPVEVTDIDVGAVIVSIVSVTVETIVLYDTTVEVLADCVTMETIVVDSMTIDETVLIKVDREVTVEIETTVVVFGTHFELAIIYEQILNERQMDLLGAKPELDFLLEAAVKQEHALKILAGSFAPGLKKLGGAANPSISEYRRQYASPIAPVSSQV